MNVNTERLLQEALQQVTLGPNRQIIGDAVKPQKRLYFVFQHEDYDTPHLVTNPRDYEYKVLIDKPYCVVNWKDDIVYISASGNTMEELNASWAQSIKDSWGYGDTSSEADAQIDDIIRKGVIAFCRERAPDGDSTEGSAFIGGGKAVSTYWGDMDIS